MKAHTLWLPKVILVDVHPLPHGTITHIYLGDYSEWGMRIHAAIMYHNRNSRGVIKVSSIKYYPT